MTGKKLNNKIYGMLLIAVFLSALGLAVSLFWDTGREMTVALLILTILLAAAFLLFRRILTATDPDRKLAARAEAFLMPADDPADGGEEEIKGKFPGNQ